MILYIKISKDATRKLLELTDEFNKVTGYKIKEAIYFLPATKIIKDLGINLTKAK